MSTPEPRRPARVAVLVDRDCASSCEEFLLAARQSFHVKLIGRNSEGALDYSNLRLHALPSGVRQLQYATSRSARLPQLQVDLGGIMPDIYLPPPKDEAGRAQEIVRVQRWLEGGRRAALKKCCACSAGWKAEAFAQAIFDTAGPIKKSPLYPAGFLTNRARLRQLNARYLYTRPSGTTDPRPAPARLRPSGPCP